METLNASQPHWTEIGLYEYLLVAHPTPEVNKKVVAEKEFFSKEYKQGIAIKTHPHITIGNFLAKEAMEDTLVRYIERISSRRASFNVELNNYSGYPSRTIFIRVQNQQPFKDLIKELKVISNYVDSCSCPPVQFKTPHMSIARRLPESIYSKAMMDYSQKTFHDTFMVSELVLLRRRHQYDACKTMHVFKLQPADFKPFENTLFS